MKLARKFAVALFLGMCAVLAVEAILTSRREVALVQVDMKRDHENMGHMLEQAFTKIWERDSEAGVREFAEKLQAFGGGVAARWVWINDPEHSEYGPKLPRSQLGPIMKGQLVVKMEPDDLYTYVPVPVDPNRPAAIELVESRKDEQLYRRANLFRILMTTGAAAAVSGLLAMVIGIWFVGRPTHKLIDRARRVGAGDFSSKLELHQRDELSELAAELNAMCDRLREAHEKVAAETAARIATIEQLRHADRLATVGKLASGVAHELGTPLNVVLARAKMIASSSASGGEASSNARIIAEQSEHMTKIIRQLLDFARPRSPRKSRVDLWQVVNQTLSLLKPMAQRRRASFVFEGDGAPVEAEVDPDQMQQVLTNLAVNGMQAMPDGGKLTVEIHRERRRPPPDQPGPEAEYICLRVKDEGVGISEENKLHLFEPFFTTKDIGEGTGLGLSVSRGILREHGGWIGVESQPGKGSCFAIYLPER